jgi:hypothetical protein
MSRGPFVRMCALGRRCVECGRKFCVSLVVDVQHSSAHLFLEVLDRITFVVRVKPLIRHVFSNVRVEFAPVPAEVVVLPRAVRVEAERPEGPAHEEIARVKEPGSQGDDLGLGCMRPLKCACELDNLATQTCNNGYLRQ